MSTPSSSTITMMPIDGAPPRKSSSFRPRTLPKPPRDHLERLGIPAPSSSLRTPLHPNLPPHSRVQEACRLALGRAQLQCQRHSAQDDQPRAHDHPNRFSSTTGRTPRSSRMWLQSRLSLTSLRMSPPSQGRVTPPRDRYPGADLAKMTVASLDLDKWDPVACA